MRRTNWYLLLPVLLVVMSSGCSDKPFLDDDENIAPVITHSSTMWTMEETANESETGDGEAEKVAVQVIDCRGRDITDLSMCPDLGFTAVAATKKHLGWLNQSTPLDTMTVIETSTMLAQAPDGTMIRVLVDQNALAQVRGVATPNAVNWTRIGTATIGAVGDAAAPPLGAYILTRNRGDQEGGGSAVSYNQIQLETNATNKKCNGDC